ncbi:unnamed protein product [Polarella glacialis]|uniref:MYND-type domain-containing protein n=1 Tax=Polarella glacialis TaxID=89957 RepID=A0A813GBA4_POLGL|nr:unnamed protein product [Polarella glacialis]
MVTCGLLLPEVAQGAGDDNNKNDDNDNSNNNSDNNDKTLPWHLEAQLCPKNLAAIWRLFVTIPLEECKGSLPPFDVDIGEVEICLRQNHSSKNNNQDNNNKNNRQPSRCLWRLLVPAQAQPIAVDIAKCSYSHRRHELAFEWPRLIPASAPSRSLAYALTPPATTTTTTTFPSLEVPAARREDTLDATIPEQGVSAMVTPSGDYCGDKRAAHLGTSVAEENLAAATREDAVKLPKKSDSAAAEAESCSKEQSLESEPSSGASGSKKSICDHCGLAGASMCCSKCKRMYYCGRDCQRRAWAEDHRWRCKLASKALACQLQRGRGDFALSLVTAEECLKAFAKAAKDESDKEYAFDGVVVAALVRGIATACVGITTSLVAGAEEIAREKFCRASFSAVATMLDVAASLKQERCPLELWLHVEAIVSGLEGQLSEQADKTLSAWMFYDGLARGLEDRPSHYQEKLPQLKACALLALRDALAASHDILEVSCSWSDKRIAAQADQLLDEACLRVGPEHLVHLRPYYGKRGQGEDESSEED